MEYPIAPSFSSSSFDSDRATTRAKSALTASISVKTALRNGNLEPLVQISHAIAESIRDGGKVLLCGNGGSAADCQHLATEFVVRLTSKRNRIALPALALTTDTSTLTAASNDYGFDQVFSRQIEALGCSGDVLIGFSTSGTSKNILFASETAKRLGITTIGFLGSHLDTMKLHLDYILSVPSPDPARIQEAHITLGHIMVDLVECDLFGFPVGEP